MMSHRELLVATEPMCDVCRLTTITAPDSACNYRVFGGPGNLLSLSGSTRCQGSARESGCPFPTWTAVIVAMRDVVSAVGGAIWVLVGAVLLAVALYFVVVIGAVLLGVLLMMVLARAAARFMA